jgi:hypothetical protein
MSLFGQSYFEGVVMHKGYHYDSELSSDKLAQYQSDWNRYNGIKDGINRTLEGHSIAYSTTDQQYYSSMKDSLESYGYTYQKHEPVKHQFGTSIFYWYKKEHYTAVLYSFTIKNVPFYVVGVTWN